MTAQTKNLWAPIIKTAKGNPDIVGLIDAAGFKTWDSRFFALCKSVAAHCRGGANHG